MQAVAGAVRCRAVDQHDVMERGLAGRELDADRLVLVDADLDLLAARQQVVLVEGVAVGDLLVMAAGHELHAAVREVGRGSRRARRS